MRVHGFIGRDAQLRSLDHQFDGAASAFAVIYGRRRVGKTELIK